MTDADTYADTDADTDADALRHTADQLLGVTARIRRTLRRGAARPGILSGLTSAQLELVHLLRREPGLSVAQAAERLRLAPNTVSTLVGQLVTTGLVVRGTDRSDGRVVRLDLEPATRQRVSEWRDRRVEALTDAMGALSYSDRRLLGAATPVLSRLAEALDPERPADAEGERADQRTGAR